MLAHKLSSGGFPVKSNRRLRVATIPLKMAAQECQPPNLQTFAKPQPDSLPRGKSGTEHQVQSTVFGSYPSQRRPSCLPNSFAVETCKMQNVLIYYRGRREFLNVAAQSLIPRTPSLFRDESPHA